LGLGQVGKANPGLVAWFDIGGRARSGLGSGRTIFEAEFEVVKLVGKGGPVIGF